MVQFHKLLALMILVFMTGIMATSCSSDNDDPQDVSIVGKWAFSESFDYDEDETESVTMLLTFNSDRTGSIEEYWVIESRATSSENYRMDFSWTTSSDANGNEILKVSYLSGDKNTELFPGGSSTVLWTRQFVLTGNILNIHGGDGVWVFKRK